MAFGIFVELCVRHHNWFLEHFYYPKKKPCTHWWSLTAWAVLTKYHRSSGFKIEMYFSQFWRLRSPKMKVLAKWISF